MILCKRSIAARSMLLLFLLFSWSSASAWDSFVGQESCEFVAAQMQQDDEVAGLIVAAFVTGVNYATGRSTDTDVAGLVDWVKNYCTKNPSERFLDALLQLDQDLDARQKPAEEEEKK